MSGAAPFLTVITRTQGRRPHTLAETLASLAAQTDQDFEVLLLAHRVEPAALPALAAMLRTLPPGRPARLITVDHGTRTAPLNVGLEEAAGDYIAVLDDDDLALPNWVALFRRLSESAPGKMLRAGNLRQNCREVWQNGVPRVQPVGAPVAMFPDRFDFFAHLSANHTAPVMLAFPRARLRALGLRFDDSLTTTEDWDFIIRCAGPLGCADSPEISSIYRYWESGESSRTVHTEAEWRANFAALTAKWDSAPFILPAGYFLPLRQMADGLAAATAALAALRAETAAAAALRRDILEILGSRSWRISAPLRLFRGISLAAVAAAPADQLPGILAALRASSSWRLTAPLRGRYAAPAAGGKPGP